MLTAAEGTDYIIPILIGIELLLLPITLVANTVTMILVVEGQDDDEISSVCLHVPSRKDEAERVWKSQSSSASESKSELL